MEFPHCGGWLPTLYSKIYITGSYGLKQHDYDCEKAKDEDTRNPSDTCLETPMKKILKYLVLSLMVGLGIPTQGAEGDDHLIVPGVRAGAIVLGQPVTRAVFKELGKPTSHEKASPGPQGRDGGHYDWEDNILIKLNDGKVDNNVFSIYIGDRNRNLKTDKGIRIGSPFSAVEKFYPSGKKEEGPECDFDWVVTGISFTICTERVMGISIYPLDQVQQ